MQYIQGPLGFSSIIQSHYWLLVSLIIVSFLLGALSMAYFSLRASLKKPLLGDKDNDNLINRHYGQASDNAFLSQQIKTVIKNLSNSQYVLKDEQRFTSLYQTPLRQNIHHLRLISESLMNNSESAEYSDPIPRNESISSSYCHPFFVLQRQVETISKLCDQCKIGFSSHLNISPDIVVTVSSDWLAGAIHEVLVNAIKQNNQDIKLSISAQTVDNLLFINVVDNGVGISSATSQQFSEEATNSVHLFRRKSDSENLMNLSLIQDKLLALGGRVVVRSARKFRTQVSLQVPINLAEVTDLGAYSRSKILNTVKPKRNAGNSATPRVLWVAPFGQAEFKVSNQLVNRLQQDFIIREEYSIEDALSCIADYRPDCVVVDEDLNVNKSFLVQAWVKASDNFADIPIVTMGALVDNSTQLRLMQTGITARIEKPIVFCELRSLISNVVAEKHKLLNKVEEAIANYHLNAMDHIDFEDKEGERFFTMFNQLLEDNFQDYDFRLAEAAKLMHMSDKTLSRKIGKYYRLKFPDLMKKFRLNKAKDLIIRGERVTTVAYGTGFNSPSYFTQCFRAEFGFAPSMLAKEQA